MNKKIFYLGIMAVLLAGVIIACSKDETNPDQESSFQAKTTIPVNPANTGSSTAIIQHFFPSASSLVGFEITDDGAGNYFLFAKENCGTGATSCKIYRVKIDRISNNFVFNSSSSFGETCAGDPCENCGFKSTGGCECKDRTEMGQPYSGRKCNHTITSS